MPLPSHSSRFFFTCTIMEEEYRSLSSSLCSFIHFPVTSFLLGPNILLKTLFSNTLSLRSSLNVSNHVSHPYRTTGKNIVLCILTFIFIDSKLEDRRIYTERYQASFCLVITSDNNLPILLNSHKVIRLQTRGEQMPGFRSLVRLIFVRRH